MKRSIKKISLMIACLFLSVVALTACDEKSNPLNDAAARIILTQDKQVVANNFDVSSVVVLDGVTYTVTWASNDENVCKVGALNSETKLYKILVEPSTVSDTEITLTATISDGTNSVTKEFEFTVPRLVVVDVAGFRAAANGTVLAFKGVIVAKEVYSASYKNTSVYLKAFEGTGGVMAYRLVCASQEAYDNDLAIGNVIVVTGSKTVYNGLHEFAASCTYRLTSETKQTVTAVDISSDIAGGVDLLKHQSTYVEFKNAKITSIGTKTSGSSFNIGAEIEGKAISVRVNTYFTPDDSAAYKEFFELDLAVGKYINVKGVCGWNSKAEVYPLATGDIVLLAREVDPADKLAAVEAEVKALGIKTTYNETETFEVPTAGTTYTDVTVAWAAKAGSEDIISVATVEGKIKVTVTVDVYKETEATLVATLTVGTTNKNVEFVVKVKLLTEPPKVLASTSLLADKKVGDTFTANDLVIAYINRYSYQSGGNTYDNSYMIAQNTEGAVIIKSFDDETYAVGDKINITSGKVATTTYGPISRSLHVADDAEITKVSSGNDIPVIDGSITIDWAVESSLINAIAKDSAGDYSTMFGTYVVLENVKFDMEKSTPTYGYFVRENGLEYRIGIYEGFTLEYQVKALDGTTATAVTADKYYTVRGYLVGTNGFTTGGESPSIIRINMYEIEEQDGLFGEEKLIADQVAGFKADHAEALALTVETVTEADKAKVQAALTEFATLLEGAKTALATEKALLDSLLEARQVAGFKAGHAEALALTLETVTEADKAKIQAALTEFATLVEGAKTALATEKALLDSLLAAVTPAQETEEVTIKSNLISTSTSTSMSGNNDANTFFGLNADEYSIKSYKNDRDIHIGLNKDATVRLYNDYNNKKAGNGNSLEIIREGYLISSVTITFKSNSNLGATCLVNGTETLTTAGLAYDPDSFNGTGYTFSKTETIEFSTPAESLVLLNNTIATESSQFWIVEMVITFVKK